MNKLLEVLRTFVMGAAGEDADIVQFRNVLVVSLLAAIVSWAFIFAIWNGQTRIVFAVPDFPSMGDCERIQSYLADGDDAIHDEDLPWPPRIISTYDDVLTDDASRDLLVNTCEYNLNLFSAYSETLRPEMTGGVALDALADQDIILNYVAERSEGNLIPRSELWNISAEAMIKLTITLVTTLGMFLVATLSKQSREKIYPLDEPRILLSNLILNLILIFLAFCGVDILWFVIERVVPQPLIYGVGTATVFVTIVTGIYCFIYLSWVIRLDLVHLSIFTSLILLGGLILGILVTTQVWNAGATNAFSIMSEIAYPERIAYEILGTVGSRNVFRATFFGSGLLIIAFYLRLNDVLLYVSKTGPEVVSKLEEEVADLEEAAKEADSRGAKAAYATDDRLLKLKALTEKYQKADFKLANREVLIWGIIAGIGVMFVGIFPTDGFPDLFGITSKGWSNTLHEVGARTSPIIFLYMMITYWFTAYPSEDVNTQGNKIDRFLPFSSLVLVFITGTAILMHLYGGIHPSSEPSPRSYIFVIAFTILLIFIIHFVQWRRVRNHSGDLWRNVIWGVKDDDNYSPIFSHWLPMVVIGVILGWLFPDLMNTVAVEFIILTNYSLFLVSYSTYLIEYKDDLTRLLEDS